MPRPFSPSSNMTDSIVEVSEGNPGALSVLVKLAQEVNTDPLAFMSLLDLDDMGLRGPSIWLGFNDWAGRDMAKFRKRLSDRDQSMVDTINRNGGKAWKSGRSYV